MSRSRSKQHVLPSRVSQSHVVVGEAGDGRPDPQGAETAGVRRAVEQAEQPQDVQLGGAGEQLFEAGEDSVDGLLALVLLQRLRRADA